MAERNIKTIWIDGKRIKGGKKEFSKSNFTVWKDSQEREDCILVQIYHKTSQDSPTMVFAEEVKELGDLVFIKKKEFKVVPLNFGYFWQNPRFREIINSENYYRG